MLDTQTKRRIDDCRDILVGKLPDPKAQIEQITIGLIYKFMDDMDKEAVELGGKAKFFSDYKVPDPEFPNDRKKDKVIEFSKYAWDKLMHPKVTASEMLTLYSEAIGGMEKNPNVPQLFRDIFKNAYLPYRDPETLKMFLKTIGEFEYTHSEKLGDAFEYLLSVMGSQGDAGQFRTPRHIIDFLVAIINPDKIDSILDPACGTAGFLISAYKHILLKYSKANKHGLNIYQYNQLKDEEKFPLTFDKLTPDDRKRLIQNFVGYDISPDMVRLSLVNLYLHGFNTPNIHEYDTLSSEENWNENFDVVLANPPFMSPKGGIRPHKRFTISSNRSEVLFVDYIAEHLNPRGKAGIIVPEGIIFQSGTAYKELRKMLVENHLYAVVSLPAGVFNPYSGVKTSILLMDKVVAKKRDEILFIKIDNDGYNLGAQRTAVKGGQLEEAIKLARIFVETGAFEETTVAHLVPKADIAKNGDYNLSGERYRSVGVLSTKYESVKLGEVCRVINGRAYKQDELLDNGKYPVMRVGNFFSNRSWYYSDLELDEDKYCENGDLLYAWSASFGPKIWDGEKCIYHYHIWKMVPDEVKINKHFLYHVLNRETESIKAEGGRGIAMIHITKGGIEAREIPLPPLSIQEEIVTEIEGYQKIIDGAKQVVNNYKPTIKINPDWDMVQLGDEIEFISGVTLSIPDCEDENGIPIISMADITEEGEITTHRIRKVKIKKGNYYTLQKGDLLFNWRNGSKHLVGKTGYFDLEGEYVFASFCLGIRAKQRFLPRFLWYLLNQYRREELYYDFMRQNINGLFNREELKILLVPVPTIAEQESFIKSIEEEMQLVNSNKRLVEIFEQKIKDRIARVWGAEKAVNETGVLMAAEPEPEYAKKKTTQ